jgi:hypothetical protein
MATQSPSQSILATLLGAGRQFGERTCQESKELSTQFRQSCSTAAKSLNTLRQHDRKVLMRKVPAAVGRFLFDTYVKRPLALLQIGMGKRTAGFMITGLVPLLLAVATMLLPLLIFSSPQSEAYYYFARTLAFDPISLLPVLIGIIVMGALFRFPPAEQTPGEKAD